MSVTLYAPIKLHLLFSPLQEVKLYTCFHFVMVIFGERIIIHTGQGKNVSF